MSTTSQDLNTLFSEAIEKDENEAIRLLGQNTDLATIYLKETPVLVIAASKHRWKLLQELIKYQKNIDITAEQGSYKGITALWYAVALQQWNLSEQLVKLGARSFDVASAEGPDKGTTALWWAVNWKQWDLSEQMIKLGARSFDATPAAEGSYKGITALWWAVNGKQWNLVDQMIKLNARSFDSTPAEGRYKGITALWYAVSYKQWDLAEQMIKLGARSFDVSPAEGPNKGLTSLWCTFNWGHWGLAEQMIKLGARSFDSAPAEGPNKGITMLWWIIKHRKWDLAKLMIAHGARGFDASPAEGTDKGLTALWFAVGWQQWDLAEQMIKLGARSFDVAPMEGRNEGKTTLWCAFNWGQWGLAEQMIKLGARSFDADPAEPNKGKTALWYAFNWEQWGLAEQMIKLGARSFDAAPAEGPNKGLTTLWLSVYFKNIKIFKQLLSLGASIDVFDAVSMTENKNLINFIQTIKNLFDLLSDKSINKEQLKSEIEITSRFNKACLNARYKKKTLLQVAIENSHEDAVNLLLNNGANLFLINKDILEKEYQSSIINLIIKLNQLKNKIEAHLVSNNPNFLADNMDASSSSAEQTDSKEAKKLKETKELKEKREVKELKETKDSKERTEIKESVDNGFEIIDTLIKQILELCVFIDNPYQSILYFEFVKQLMQIFPQVNKEVLLKILNSISNKIGKKKYEQTQSFLAQVKYALHASTILNKKPTVQSLDENDNEEDNNDNNKDKLLEILNHLLESGNYADKGLLIALAGSLKNNSSTPTKLFGIDLNGSPRKIINKLVLFLLNKKDNKASKRTKERKETDIQITASRTLQQATAIPTVVSTNTTTSTIVSFSSQSALSSSASSIALPASAVSVQNASGENPHKSSPARSNK